MARYRKRAVEVEAQQWFPGLMVPGVCLEEYSGRWYVVTVRDQRAYLEPGAWVIFESDGRHHYTCTDQEFRLMYEEVVDGGVIEHNGP